MDDKAILDELLLLLEAHGVSVRDEPMGRSAGGLCMIKGKATFFIDKSLPAAETAVVCGQAVGEVVDIEAVYLKPQVRDFLGKIVI